MHLFGTCCGDLSFNGVGYYDSICAGFHLSSTSRCFKYNPLHGSIFIAPTKSACAPVDHLIMMQKACFEKCMVCTFFEVRFLHSNGICICIGGKYGNAHSLSEVAGL